MASEDLERLHALVRRLDRLHDRILRSDPIQRAIWIEEADLLVAQLASELRSGAMGEAFDRAIGESTGSGSYPVVGGTPWSELVGRPQVGSLYERLNAETPRTRRTLTFEERYGRGVQADGRDEGPDHEDPPERGRARG